MRTVEVPTKSRPEPRIYLINSWKTIDTSFCGMAPFLEINCEKITDFSKTLRGFLF
jgi:hypothetical protein